ncbi:enkurin isoform X2 [Paramormyrops kingsleyae]|nr:enkurin isoform X2 [Paramormyrops kingsleyae]XP_023679339.1 enkurin isoform X2 [Paramormyrops kingsleyae]
MSKFREQVNQEKELNRAKSKTMGPAKVDVPSPEKYLLKHSKEPRLPERKLFAYKDNGKEKKPQVPKKTDKPLMGIHTQKNFIKNNAMETITAAPKKPQAISVDTENGDKQLLESSGLVPKYVKKKDYGQAPEYLQQRRDEVRRAQQAYDDYIRERLREGAMKQVSEEERQAVLQGLKMNWEELHRQYQGLSVVTDTVLKKQRKERLEREMKQLEKDMELVEKNKIIYVAKS